MFVDGMLHSLVRKVKTPDIEFVFNVGDWVRVNQSTFNSKFSFKQIFISSVILWSNYFQVYIL